MSEFTYERTEASVYNLMIWWGQVIPFEHSDDCTHDPHYIHCCFGKPSKSRATIEMASCVERGEFIDIIFTNLDTGASARLKSGDKIVYLGDYRFELRNG